MDTAFLEGVNAFTAPEHFMDALKRHLVSSLSSITVEAEYVTGAVEKIAKQILSPADTARSAGPAQQEKNYTP